MFAKVLVANRGEIACRIIRTLRRMGVGSVAVYTDADRASLHVAAADEAVRIGDGPAATSYLDADRLVATALATGADGVHPGYGFLSENAGFAEACAAAGVTFIGPTPQQVRQFGDKHQARRLAADAGVPLLPGTGLLSSRAGALAAADRIGHPIMLKASAGGGGIGMRRCSHSGEVEDAFDTVARLAQTHFGGGGVYLERFVARARHVEVQLFGDGRDVVALGERDCSAQRRNQKVLEETPAPGLTPEMRAALHGAALRLARHVNYRSAGTVEFVLDADRDQFFFLEVNTRLQVEHPVTELTWGVDLVEWMVREAAGELAPLPSLVDGRRPGGVAMEARIYAEDPAHGFRPASGELSKVSFPPGMRVDTWVESGTEVSPFYDPLLAKLVVWADDRPGAIAAMGDAVAATTIAGIETNLSFLADVLADEEFGAGRPTTALLDSIEHRPRVVEVLDGGLQTTVQDLPGRLGYWSIGVPPTGPMDDVAFRAANALVGNPAGTPALELTRQGPALRFGCDAVIALAGAPMAADLDGGPIVWATAVAVRAGSTLRIGPSVGAGARAYLAIAGGIDVPEYLGSRSTFMLGRFGGVAGRALRRGDAFRLGSPHGDGGGEQPAEVPAYPSEWEIGVLDGPHGAPDFFTPADIDAIYGAAWEVHHHSDRTGVRLIGPKPEWARTDGGEAGLHPSNIHDNPYAIGTVDFTGDMPVVLGPDGPSLGGFVCPVTVVAAERWKLGQLSPGDTVRFVRRSEDRRTVVGQVPAAPDRPAVAYRRCGDDHLLVEYGPDVLDLELRFRVHALMEALDGEGRIAGLRELAPGIRSLQVRYDPAVVGLDSLLAQLATVELSLPATADLEVPSRIVHLPLSWDDPATRLAIERYMKVVRDDAPWCPSNLEFIRRVNGLDSIDDVHRIVFDATYLVLGLGDVYLGAPVATPLDPRHRLVTTKYNPARTWTPENAVGIGGAYLCIYGMEGPGGYQFVGRTLQVWNRYRDTSHFGGDRRWLLRFFDQLRFHPVSAAELLEQREAFGLGRLALDIEETTLRLADHRHFLAEHAASITAFKQRRQAAFDAERRRWEASGELARAGAAAVDRAPAAAGDDRPVPDGAHGVDSPVHGCVQRVAQVGDTIDADGVVLVVEAMKTETAVVSPAAGQVIEVRCRPGDMVAPGRALVVVGAA